MADRMTWLSGRPALGRCTGLSRFIRPALVLVVLAAAAQAVPPERPPGDEMPARLDALLENIEKANVDLRSIRNPVRFEQEDKVNLTKQIKVGAVRFKIDEERTLFLIHFDRSEVDGVAQKQEWYLWDGRWLYQVLERLRQVTKTEYARPGESLNLFDLESAPFPLPFGHRKAEILRNCEVTLAESEPGDPADTDHLICIPKPESRLNRDYDRLDFYFRRDIHLPSRIVAVREGGYEVTKVDFPDLSEKSLNVGLSEGDFDPLPAWKGFKQVVEPLQPPPTRR